MDIPLPCFQDFIEIGLGPVTLFPSQSKCRAAPISFPTLAKCISCLKFPRAWFSKEYNWTVRDWWCKGRAKVVENNVMPRWKLVRLRIWRHISQEKFLNPHSFEKLENFWNHQQFSDIFFTCLCTLHILLIKIHFKKIFFVPDMYIFLAILYKIKNRLKKHRFLFLGVTLIWGGWRMELLGCWLSPSTGWLSPTASSSLSTTLHHVLSRLSKQLSFWHLSSTISLSSCIRLEKLCPCPFNSWLLLLDASQHESRPLQGLFKPTIISTGKWKLLAVT